jgi:hypothetical protein
MHQCEERLDGVGVTRPSDGDIYVKYSELITVVDLYTSSRRQLLLGCAVGSRADPTLG